MPVVNHTSNLPVPAKVCFDYIDTADNVPKFVFGVKKFRYITDSKPRLGAGFAIQMQLGPIKLTLRGQISEYVEDELICLSLDEGLITGTVSWGVSPIDARQCSTSVDVTYRIASGLTGRALSKVIDSILDPAIKHTESQLREQVTTHYRAFTR